MRARRLAPLLLAALSALAGCAGRPDRGAPDFYRGGPGHRALAGISDIRLAPVQAPTLLRHASVTSRLPLYGMVTPQPDPTVLHGSRPSRLADLADLDALLLVPLRAHLQVHPLPGAPRLDGGPGAAVLQLSLPGVVLLGKDVREQACVVLVTLQAKLLAPDGRLLWSAGRINLASDDRQVVRCDDVLADRRLLATALADALRRAEGELFARLDGVSPP